MPVLAPAFRRLAQGRGVRAAPRRRATGLEALRRCLDMARDRDRGAPLNRPLAQLSAMGDNLHKHPAATDPGRARLRRSSRAWAGAGGPGRCDRSRARSPSPARSNGAVARELRSRSRSRCRKGSASRSCGVRAASSLALPSIAGPSGGDGAMASSAAMRSPVAASRRSLQRAAVVGHELGMKAGTADLHVEGLLGGQVGVLRLHRRDHPVHGAALEGVHGRRPGPVDMAQLGIVSGQRQRPAVLQPERNRSVADRRHLRRAAVHQPVPPCRCGSSICGRRGEAPWRPRRRPPPHPAAPPALRAPRRQQRRVLPRSVTTPAARSTPATRSSSPLSTPRRL